MPGKGGIDPIRSGQRHHHASGAGRLLCSTLGGAGAHPGPKRSSRRGGPSGTPAGPGFRAGAADRIYADELNRPQPSARRRSRRGMTVSIGRLRRCPVLDYKFIALGHNTIRGAAGGDSQRRADASRRAALSGRTDHAYSARGLREDGAARGQPGGRCDCDVVGFIDPVAPGGSETVPTRRAGTASRSRSTSPRLPPSSNVTPARRARNQSRDWHNRLGRRTPRPFSRPPLRLASEWSRRRRRASVCSSGGRRAAARLFARQPDYGAWIHEAHHAARKTRLRALPSCSSRRWSAAVSTGRSTCHPRAGLIPGTHTVGFDGPAGRLPCPMPRDRTGFARGALSAARFVQGRRGWFTMKDVLELDGAPVKSSG